MYLKFNCKNIFKMLNILNLFSYSYSSLIETLHNNNAKSSSFPISYTIQHFMMLYDGYIMLLYKYYITFLSFEESFEGWAWLWLLSTSMSFVNKSIFLWGKFVALRSGISLNVDIKLITNNNWAIGAFGIYDVG